MTTFNDLLTRVRYDLSEISPVTWSDNELFLYLKEGYKFLYQVIASEAPDWLTVIESYTLTPDNTTITLPQDTMFVYSICDDKGYQILKLPLQDCYYYLLREPPSSRVLYWARKQNELIFAPKPQGEFQVYVFRVPLPQEVSSLDDEVPMNEIFHQFIVEYAVIRAHNRNERPTLVEQNFMAVKLEAIRSLLAREGSLQSISPNINWNVFG